MDVTILEHSLALAPQVEPQHILMPSNSTSRHRTQKNSCPNAAGDMYEDAYDTKNWKQRTVTEESE